MKIYKRGDKEFVTVIDLAARTGKSGSGVIHAAERAGIKVEKLKLRGHKSELNVIPKDERLGALLLELIVEGRFYGEDAPVAEAAEEDLPAGERIIRFNKNQFDATLEGMTRFSGLIKDICDTVEIHGEFLAEKSIKFTFKA